MATENSENKVKTSVFSCLRWSSQPQSWGDSERRQLQAAETWCRQRGLTLADHYEDRGVSAWNDKNQERALGDLLKIAKRGDYLLVEDADRLFRQDWLTALNFVAGITACTGTFGGLRRPGRCPPAGSTVHDVIHGSRMLNAQLARRGQPLPARPESVDSEDPFSRKGVQTGVSGGIIPL
jgi:hypothetical protein